MASERTTPSDPSFERRNQKTHFISTLLGGRIRGTFGDIGVRCKGAKIGLRRVPFKGSPEYYLGTYRHAYEALAKPL